MPSNSDGTEGERLSPQVDDWSRDTQKLAVLSWISFLSACVGSTLMFAYLDPLVIVDSLGIDFFDSSNGGYAVGFFSIWAYTWVSGWLVLRLVRRKRNWPQRS